MLLTAAVSTSASRDVLGFESQRSLGNGALAAMLASPDAAIAARAALAIGRTKQPDGVALLEGHLKDRRAAVRAFSIYGIGLIGLGSDATEIISAARVDGSGAARVAALDAIGRYEDGQRLTRSTEASAATALIEILRSDPDPIIRGRAAISLSFFADGPQGKRVAPVLTAAIDADRNQDVRERVMWTIFRRYAGAVSHTVLEKALHDRDEIVRIEAIRAYGKLKQRSFASELKPMLSDPSWRVQEQAAESIRVLDGGKPTEHWTAIPRYVHVPSVGPDPLSEVAPRPRVSAAPGAPRPQDALEAPVLLPSSAADMTAAARGPHPQVRIRTTQGDLYVVLYPEWAPLTVLNFLNLLNRGFYDDNRWFRIVPDFVVQTGEKDDKRQPGPGYTIVAEENPLEQNSYVISMGLDYDAKTNTPIRDSAGSEYYVTLSPQYHLDESFTVFGAVTSGFDVLGRLTQADRVVRIERIPDAVL
jgi:peptidyl-prolyl cis-trans isomerase B (cyclophilin B)